jgi:hypothetical protein
MTFAEQPTSARRQQAALRRSDPGGVRAVCRTLPGSIGKRQVEFLQLEIGKTAAAMSVAEGGLEAQGLIAVHHRLLKSVYDRPSKASAVEGGRVLRVEPDRLVKVLDGAVVLASVLVADAAVAEGRG